MKQVKNKKGLKIHKENQVLQVKYLKIKCHLQIQAQILREESKRKSMKMATCTKWTSTLSRYGDQTPVIQIYLIHNWPKLRAAETLH